MKRTNAPSIASITLAFLATAAASQGAVLVGYDFGNSTAPNTTPTTPTPGLTATNFTGNGGPDWGNSAAIGDTTGLAASGTTFGSTDTASFGSVNSGLSTGSLSAAVAAGDYAGFTITATTPGTLSISGFSLDSAKAGGTGVRNPAANFNVLAVINGGSSFSTSDAITSDQFTTAGQSQTEWQSLFIDLSANSTFQNIDSVEFRIYVWGGGNTASSSRMNFDQVVAEGSLIPEPSSSALLGLGAGILALRRRRQAP